jgi:hypothetical protein
MDRSSEVLLVPAECVVTRRTGVVRKQDSADFAAGLMANCGCRHLTVVEATTRRKEATDEGDRGDGQGRGNGRDEAG